MGFVSIYSERMKRQICKLEQLYLRVTRRLELTADHQAGLQSVFKSLKKFFFERQIAELKRTALKHYNRILKKNINF